MSSLAERGGTARVPAILDTIDALIVVLDPCGRILTFNQGCERATGFPCQEVRGRSIWDALIPAEERDGVARVFGNLRDLQLPSRYENHWLTKDGGRRLIAWSNDMVRDESGEALYVVGTGIDVTARDAAEAALRESEARLHAIVRTAADAIVTIDERGVIESVNTAGEQMFGYAAGELVGRRVTILMPEPFRSGHDDYVAGYVRTGEARVIGRKCEARGRRKEGETFPIELSVSEVRLAAGTRLFTAIIHDLTSRKRLEREIIEVSGNEQRRIGQDLHDGLCQHLTGIAFACQAMINELGDHPTHARRLENIRAMVDEAIGQARRLARGLQPVLVGPHALTSALKELSRHAQELFDVSCRFTSHQDLPEVDQPTATHLYRIAQEAITNAVRHGGADRILVRLSLTDGGSLRLTVKDNGVGMAAVPGDGSGMGMHIMRYRAAVVGASLAIESRPGAGATVTCTLPTNSRSSHEIDYSM